MVCRACRARARRSPCAGDRRARHGVTWVRDIRTWPAPRPADDGVSLLVPRSRSLPRRFGRIGWELGRESIVRMPMIDYLRVKDGLAGLEFVDGTPIIRALRGSSRRPRSSGFASSARSRATASRHCRRNRDRRQRARRMPEAAHRSAGARRRRAPYLIGVAGPGGSNNIIMGPTDRRIERGDILIIDTGTTFDGYYCDFDRNFAFGPLRGCGAARPRDRVGRDGGGHPRARARRHDDGSLARDDAASGGRRTLGNNVGRIGHGLGLQLTEPPSNMPGDDTPIVAEWSLPSSPAWNTRPAR